MKRIFVIDWVLVTLFVTMAISGFMMHIAGNRFTHDAWHGWAVIHSMLSVLFLIAAALHIQTHWGWYKGWFKKGLRNKSRVTAVISAVFIIVSITGVTLLVAADGANSPMGLWHYRIGILFTLLAVGHIIKRIPILRKSLK